MIRTEFLPLDHIWPLQVARTAPAARRNGTFRATYGSVLTQLSYELERWKVDHAMIGTGLRIGANGRPIYVNRAVAEDPGAAVQFMRGDRPVTFYADSYLRFEANLRAVSLTLANLRAIERYNAGQLFEAMMTGLAQLPPPASHWSQLGLAPGASADEIKAAFRARAKLAHPDHGGTDEAIAQLSQARDAALAEISA